MKTYAVWFLAAAVVLAALALAGPQRAEAAGVHVHIGTPGYYSTSVYRYGYPSYHAHYHSHYGYRTAYRIPAPVYVPSYRPPVHVHTYRPAPVIVVPRRRYVPVPVVVPYPAPCYHGW